MNTNMQKRRCHWWRPGAWSWLGAVAAAFALLWLALPGVPVPPASAARSQTWSLQSVDAMKITKDVICAPKDRVYIEQRVDRAVQLGATHIAISTPYDSPDCGDAVAYTKLWISVIREKGLKVWHRQMPLAFEGIYGTPRKGGVDYLPMIRDYILANRGNYQPGDIFTPIPEPQNGGIRGFSGCNSNCQFSSIADFNRWLRDAIDVSNTAFARIGLGGRIEVGYYGFDGFVAWGDNNPDWRGILEDATIAKMGNLTIDHYPEAAGGTMDGDLSEVEARYPGVRIVIGEWGTIKAGDPVQQVHRSMGAAARHSSVVGFNYWTLGPGGNEALLNDDYSPRPQFYAVQSFYSPAGAPPEAPADPAAQPASVPAPAAVPTATPTVAPTAAPAPPAPALPSPAPAPPVPGPPPARAGANGVQNSSFEVMDGFGFPLHWVRAADGVYDGSAAHSGKASLKVTGPSANHVHQDVGLRPGAAYTLSYWIKTGELQGSGVSLQVLAGGTSLVQSAFTTASADWTQVTVTFYTPVNVTSGRVDIGWSLLPGDAIWVDDVSLVAGN